MSRIRQSVVDILNPLPGGASYTTRRSALQFVRRGLAAFESDHAIRFLNQERRIARANSSDGIGGEFWWRRGKTGGMVQQIGSITFPMARKRREADKTHEQ
jgi:hypothetical protein